MKFTTDSVSEVTESLHKQLLDITTSVPATDYSTKPQNRPKLKQKDQDEKTPQYQFSSVRTDLSGPEQLQVSFYICHKVLCFG